MNQSWELNEGTSLGAVSFLCISAVSFLGKLAAVGDCDGLAGLAAR